MAFLGATVVVAVDFVAIVVDVVVVVIVVVVVLLVVSDHIVFGCGQ